MKMADLNARDVEHAVRMIEGTARSMGLNVEGLERQRSATASRSAEQRDRTAGKTDQLTAST